MNPALIAQLRRLDGAPQVLLDPDQLVAYGYDATMGYRGAPAAVVMAETEAHIVHALATAVQLGVPCLARGGATSLSASAVPPNGALVIDTNRMRRITDFDAERRRAAVEPFSMRPTRRPKRPPRSAETWRPTPAGRMPSSTESRATP